MIAAISHAVRAARRRQGTAPADAPGSPRWDLEFTPEQWAAVDKLVAGRTMSQRLVAYFYNSPAIQITVAALIFANFVVSAVQSQLVPAEGSPAMHVFTVLEWVFNMVFLVELVVNMFGHWFWLFWGSAWNWFDFIIVAASLVALLLPNLPGIQVLEVKVEVLRLFRAFRVLRVFKRVKSLKRVVEGVMVSMPGVFNVFVIMGLIMGIWAIMGTDLYGPAMGEYFHRFLASSLTMFQCMTGDAWSAIMWTTLGIPGGWSASVFFPLYGLVICIIMLNIVMATLLDRFVSSYVQSDAPQLDQDPIVAEAVRNIASGFRSRGCWRGFGRMWSVLRGLREMERLQNSPTAARQRQARQLFGRTASQHTASVAGALDGSGSALDVRDRSRSTPRVDAGNPRRSDDGLRGPGQSHAPDPQGAAPADTALEGVSGRSDSPGPGAAGGTDPVLVLPAPPGAAAGPPPSSSSGIDLAWGDPTVTPPRADADAGLQVSVLTPPDAHPPDDDLQCVVELILQRLAVSDEFIAQQQCTVLSAMEGYESRLEELETLWQSIGGEIEGGGAVAVGGPGSGGSRGSNR